MKYIASILVFLVLVLTMVPCVDKPCESVQHNQEITHHAQGDCGHSNESQCSPFCTCQCCQTICCVSVQQPDITIATNNFSYNQLNLPVKSLELFDYYVPPKA